MQDVLDMMRQGYQIEWGLVTIPGIFNPVTPNRCAVQVMLAHNNETIDATLLPVGGIWSFPAVGDTVMIALPRGNRIPGNAGVLVIPNVNPALPGEMGITDKTPLLKYLYRLMMCLYTFAGTPLTAPPSDPAVVALHTALIAFFASVGGAAPVPPMPFPDNLQNSYTINILP